MAVPNLPKQRQITRAFIAANPTTVTLIPRVKQTMPAGGWGWADGTPREPQVMTIIEQTGLSGQPQPVATVDGVERKVEFVLLGEWESAMEIGDRFTHQGKDWDVVGIYFDNGYERRALVSARG